MASELEKAVQSLVRQAPGWQVFLPDRAPAAPIPAQRGVGRAQVGGAASAGGGGAFGSPLIEGLPGAPNSIQRTFHTAKNLVDASGVFVLQYQPLATIRFVDAGGNAVEMRYAAPP